MEASPTFLRGSGLWIALETWTSVYVPLVAGSHVLDVCLAKEYRNFDLGDDFWCLVRRRFLALASDYGGSLKNSSNFHVKVDTDLIWEITSGKCFVFQRNGWFLRQSTGAFGRISLVFDVKMDLVTLFPEEYKKLAIFPPSALSLVCLWHMLMRQSKK